MDTADKMNLQLHSLVIFRNLIRDKVILQLSDLLASASKNSFEQVSSYSSFVSQLFNKNENLTEYILDRILEDENIYILKRAEDKHIDKSLEECLQNELVILQELSQISADMIKTWLKYDGYLPIWKTKDIKFLTEYRNRLDNISTYGYGIFMKHHMFIVKDSVITPVKTPDITRLTNLKGYKREREAVIDNTLALLKGKPAANVLLYGDAGTGKSSTVKAIANEYKNQGLRIIEISKKQLTDIPIIIDSINKNCLKFILFIDDLSFIKNNDDFGALKSVLEGSVSAKTSNVVIYATSNRRHLVRESFSDRDGDDIHVNETIQEMISLSERFGLTVNFFKPDREQFFEIIHELKQEYKVEMCNSDLDIQAERYALQRGGRSPRIARQFLEHLVNTQE